MFQKLRNKFRKVAKPAVILTASFFIVATPAFALDFTNKTQLSFKTTSYWKYTDKDITLKMAECREKGLCLSVREIDPLDPNKKRAK